MSLLAHTNTARVSEAEVMAVIEPEFTKTWHPISHEKVIRSLDQAVEDRGLAVIDRTYSLSRDGAKMFGVWSIDSGSPDSCYSLGFRNSTDKSMALGVTAGDKVFVCDNMCFSGDYIAFRKHTGGLDMDQMVWMADKAIEATMETMSTFKKWHDGLKDVSITSNDMKCLTFDFMKQGVIAPSQFKAFGETVKEEYALSKECNLYTMHGGVTRLQRDKSLFQIADSTRKLSGVCDNFITARAV